MVKKVELRRHTDSDGDVLSGEGIKAAVELGGRLSDRYDLIVSSGAQRSTQTIACALGARDVGFACGVTVDASFRSEVEDRWKDAYQKGGGGDIDAFRSADPSLVEEESRRFGDALAGIFETLPDGGRALVVGHSPMQEAAIYGLTEEVVEPLSKGAGVVVTDEGADYRVEPAD